MNNTVDSTTAAAAGGGLVFVGLLFLAIGFALYLLPGIVASLRKHPQQVAIWVLTLLLGWTMIGWVAALVWSFTNSERVMVGVPMAMAQPTPAPANPATLADEIAALAKLRDQGVLTEEEFTARKRRVLGEPDTPAGPAQA